MGLFAGWDGDHRISGNRRLYKCSRFRSDRSYAFAHACTPRSPPGPHHCREHRACPYGSTERQVLIRTYGFRPMRHRDRAATTEGQTVVIATLGQQRHEPARKTNRRLQGGPDVLSVLFPKKIEEITFSFSPPVIDVLLFETPLHGASLPYEQHKTCLCASIVRTKTMPEIWNHCRKRL